MATALPIWISGTALIVSAASLGLSAYIALANNRLVKTQKRSELLTRILEAKIQYQILNQRYQDLTLRAGRISPDILEALMKYKKYEMLTHGHYEYVRAAKLSAPEIDEIRHHIDGIFLAITADNLRIDDVEKQQQGATNGH